MENKIVRVVHFVALVIGYIFGWPLLLNGKVDWWDPNTTAIFIGLLLFQISWAFLLLTIFFKLLSLI